MFNINSDIKKVLEQAETVAMIGCSPDMHRTSNYAAGFLLARDYNLIPINPEAEEVKGKKCYPSLSDVPDAVSIDIVNVFRNSRYCADAVRDVIEWKKKTGQNPVIWTQLDVSSPEAEKLAKEQDLPYIKNRCIMVEWERNFKF